MNNIERDRNDDNVVVDDDDDDVDNADADAADADDDNDDAEADGMARRRAHAWGIMNISTGAARPPLNIATETKSVMQYMVWY